MLFKKSNSLKVVLYYSLLIKSKTNVLCILGVTWTQKMPNYLHLYKPLEAISKWYNRKIVDTMVR